MDSRNTKDAMHLFTVFILTALVTISVTGCSQDNVVIGGSGFLEADEVIVSAETAGRVDSIRFGEGSQIGEGDTLLIIDPSRLELELESALAGQQVAEAGLQTANLQLEKARESERFVGAERDRIASLVKSGTATQKQLDQLEHEYAMAALGQRTAQANITAIEAELTKIGADIDRIKRQLRDCYPVAPIKGTVTEKLVEKGELLAPGKAIAKISRLDTLWVKVYLPTADFAEIKVGDKATVDTEAGEKTYSGEVVWTSEEAEFTPKNVQTRKSRTNLVYAAKVRVANSDGYLKIGMPVFVTIEK
jgi:HlyD family secretion protein